MLPTINELRAWMDGMLLHRENDSQMQMQRVSAELGRRPMVVNLVRSILDDPVHLHNSALRSYIHSNGFDKIVLLSSANPQYKLRLHLWWPNSSGQFKEHIHNHRWDFSSVVLNGAFRFQVFQPAEDGAETYQYDYTPPEDRGIFTMRLVGKASLNCVFDSLMVAETQYALSNTVLHRVISDRRELTATLFIQGPAAKASTDVFAEAPIENPESVSVPPLTDAELKHKLETFLDIIEAKS